MTRWGDCANGPRACPGPNIAWQSARPRCSCSAPAAAAANRAQRRMVIRAHPLSPRSRRTTARPLRRFSDLIAATPGLNGGFPRFPSTEVPQLPLNSLEALLALTADQLSDMKEPVTIPGPELAPVPRAECGRGLPPARGHAGARIDRGHQLAAGRRGLDLQSGADRALPHTRRLAYLALHRRAGPDLCLLRHILHRPGQHRERGGRAVAGRGRARHERLGQPRAHGPAHLAGDAGAARVAEPP